MFPVEINFHRTNAKELLSFCLLPFPALCLFLILFQPHFMLLLSCHCQICPFSLTLIFAPPPKHCHQPLALVISANLLPGSTRKAKYCLLHPLLLWPWSTHNSHLTIQGCFDFSYSISLTTSLFPLTYDLWIVPVIFLFHLLRHSPCVKQG